jgi:hypothetical protein
MQERRKGFINLEPRLAVLEDRISNNRDDTKEILSEIKNISAFIYEVKPRLEKLEVADSHTRLTKIETRNKIITYLVGVALSIATFKDAVVEMVTK